MKIQLQNVKETNSYQWEMKARWHRTVAVVAGAAVCLSVAIWLRPREPMYQGKPVSYWVDRLLEPDPGPAQIAVREFGPKATPFILAKVRREHSLSHRLYRAVWPKLPASLQRTFGKPRPRTSSHRQIVYESLAGMRAPAVPELIKALRDRSSDVRAVAAHALGAIGAEAHTAIPELIRLLSDSNGLVREEAVGALESMGPRRNQAIPALIAALKIANPPEDEGLIVGIGDEHTAVHARETAAELLGKIEPVAQGAIPELTRMLTDSTPSARVQAAIALWRINGDTDGVGLLMPELEKTEAGYALTRDWKPGDKVTLDLPMPWRLMNGRLRQADRVTVMRGPQLFCLNPSQNAALAKLDGTELGYLALDPASLTDPVQSDTVRLDGLGCRVQAWKPGVGLATKDDFELMLTEFADPDCKATYSRLRDFSAAVDDELMTGKNK